MAVNKTAKRKKATQSKQISRTSFQSKGKTSKRAGKGTGAFPVVGVGASAGGLEAFQKLLRAIPEDSGMAFVLVQHLHPSHESLLPDILARVTKIPVLQIV